MRAKEQEQDFLRRLVPWATTHGLVRAALLTSTRASPTAPVDLLSDFDVILYVTDTHPFCAPGSWLRELGTVLTTGGSPEQRDNHGMTEYVYGVFFDDMTKVDFTITPAAVLPIVRDEPRLPPGLDLGYRVLVDKDDLTVGLKTPTYSAYIPTKPTADEFRAKVEEFWWNTTYVAKYLWRDEPFAARANLDAEIRLHVLRPMLEWLIEVENGWSVRPGAWGRQLKRQLKPEVWAEVEKTFGGADDKGHWQALSQTILVFRGCAASVARSLGYEYPRELDERMMRYVVAIRDLPKKE
jgi:aminoglycoside 6-adenylyltransferase